MTEPTGKQIETTRVNTALKVVFDENCSFLVEHDDFMGNYVIQFKNKEFWQKTPTTNRIGLHPDAFNAVLAAMNRLQAETEPGRYPRPMASIRRIDGPYHDPRLNVTASIKSKPKKATKRRR